MLLFWTKSCQKNIFWDYAITYAAFYIQQSLQAGQWAHISVKQCTNTAPWNADFYTTTVTDGILIIAIFHNLSHEMLFSALELIFIIFVELRTSKCRQQHVTLGRRARTHTHAHTQTNTSSKGSAFSSVI
uniref:Uncharacterized protein n=1 Tax=Rhipicephalus zambeziensis TaxID=60191 RepID=A0A224YHP7_9ACAR